MTCTRYVALPFTAANNTYGLNYRERALNFGVSKRLQL